MDSIESLTAQIRQLVNAGVVRRVRKGLGGSHTVVTYPPLDALEIGNQPGINIEEVSQGLNLYFHIAFCEYICPFCHYAKTKMDVGHDTDRVVDYMRALAAEIQLRKSQLDGSPVESVYVGGGTPTSLSINLLEKFLADVLELSGGKPANFCLETSPLTMATQQGREKIQLFKAAGVNRFSIGVQTFNDAILQKVRGHNRATVLKGIEHLMSSGAEVNIDLMQDLPHQTRAMLDEDIAFIEHFRPHQVTWYLLRFHDEASWDKPFSRGDLDGIPDDVESAIRRILISRAMAAIGYTPRPGGRFILSPLAHDLYKEVRGGTEQTLLGFGVSAYSHGWGWFFRNVNPQSGMAGIYEYIRRMSEGQTPIAYALEMNAEERFAGRLVSSVRESIDLDWLEGPNPAARSAASVVQLLLEQGALVKSANGKIVLSNAGAPFEEEISSLFYSPTVQNRLAERGAYWAARRNPSNSERDWPANGRQVMTHRNT